MAMTLTLFMGLILSSTLGFQNEDELQQFLENVYQPNASKRCAENSKVNWQWAIDVNNKDKEKAVIESTLRSGKIERYWWETYFKNLDPSDYHNPSIQRQVTSLKTIGNAALDTEKLKKFTDIATKMTNIYSAAKVCPFNKQNCSLPSEGLSLEPELTNIMGSSTNYEELLYYWKSWRDATGAKMKSNYSIYVELSNEAAILNGYKNQGELWKKEYESDIFEQEIDRLWAQVKPLYDQVHIYTTRKLKCRYGDIIDISDGLIPAHVLGNMWAQSWAHLYDLLKPYPSASSVNITEELIRQNYTVLKMFETSNNFYLSLGLEDCSISYDTSKGAVIEKPFNRSMICHASAWDLCQGTDFRIKMCSQVDAENFITIHHEMGHIQYYLLYKNQPLRFRNGANPGFHEALGDTIAISVTTPTHLKKIGLLQNYEDSLEADINALMSMALERVVFLPFGFLIDKWRWDIFTGKIKSEEYNSRWWYYRETIQGIKAPVKRSNKTDFDGGAKYHVAGDSPYIEYFVAHILEFQFYRALCKEAGQYDPTEPGKPLHRCDFYKSLEAGNKLRKGLSLGSSKHWKDVLEVMTGERELDGGAILDYFKPLYNYLIEENKKHTV